MLDFRYSVSVAATARGTAPARWRARTTTGDAARKRGRDMRTLRKRVATGTAFAAESLSASPAFFVRPCSEPFGLLAAARRSPAASKPSSLLRFLELLLPPRLRTGDVERPRNPLDRSEEPFPFTTRDEERRRTGEALVPIVVADPQLERGCQVLGKWRRFWRCLEFGSHPKTSLHSVETRSASLDPASVRARPVPRVVLLACYSREAQVPGTGN